MLRSERSRVCSRYTHICDGIGWIWDHTLGAVLGGVGSLYMFSIPRGYTEGFQSWCKQVIATCITAFLQTTILYLGLLTYSQHPLMAMGLCLSSTEVPKVAQMFGLDTSVRINMMSVSHTLSMGSKLLGKVK